MHEKRFDPKQVHKLEDPQRLTWLPPQEIVESLGIGPGMTVADIGAGTGYFAIPIARAVGEGKVLAVDVSPEMLEHLRTQLAQDGMPSNIELHEGDAATTTLATASCDLVFFATVWHEIDDHSQALRESARLLRPLGRVAILDWSPEATRPPGPPLEIRIPRQSVEEKLKAEGWQVTRALNEGQYTYLVVAQPAPPSA
jgi:ubiquinone/menaquinone biosynthesis C-methylase UbiE